MVSDNAHHPDQKQKQVSEEEQQLCGHWQESLDLGFDLYRGLGTGLERPDNTEDKKPEVGVILFFNFLKNCLKPTKIPPGGGGTFALLEDTLQSTLQGIVCLAQ